MSWLLAGRFDATEQIRNAPIRKTNLRAFGHAPTLRGMSEKVLKSRRGHRPRGVFGRGGQRQATAEANRSRQRPVEEGRGMQKHAETGIGRQRQTEACRCRQMQADADRQRQAAASKCSIIREAIKLTDLFPWFG